MADEPKQPFDMVAATFYLVAFIFGIYALAALAAGFSCIKWPEGAGCGTGKLAEAFSTLLASALAYAAGRGSAK